LGLGTYVIQWSVTGPGGLTTTANQTVTVGAGIEAGNSFLVDDRAHVVGSVLNDGSGATSIGNNSTSGGIISVGAVNILQGATVSGNVVSASTVSSGGTVTGTITMHGTVVLPALPTLPAFPPPTGGAVTVNSGTTRNLAPGSFTQANVNGGTLILAAGDYFFQSLTLNSGSTIIRATATTRIFVQNTLVFDSPILGTTGTAVQPIFLGFAGTNLSMLAQFNGTLVAPNADVIFGTGAGIVYTGEFFGRVLEVTPASELVCKTN